MYQQQFERRIQTNRLTAWLITILLHGVVIAGIVMAGNPPAPEASTPAVKTAKTLDPPADSKKALGRKALP